MSLLERIHSPRDLRDLTRPELETLAAEIRHVIIQTVARRAGHLAPNLGVVELTLALHRVFDSPRDKIIWDVGHQSYPHKLITGRYEGFDTLRSRGGIRGYPSRDESEHDPFGTCHGSTSISAALGFAVARDLAGEKHHVVAVIGDGALTGGLAFEGLNNVGELGKRVIVVLNDNEWSISPNVGAIARYLTKLTTSRVYRAFERDVYELVGRLPKMGPRAQRLAHRVKEGLANLVVPGVLFEEFGLKYFGPIDGHDLDVLDETLRDLKRFEGPVLLHVVTKKGKGYAPAELDAGTFHGVGTFDPETGTVSKGGAKKTYTHVFGETAVEIAEQMPRVVAVTAAMTDNTGLKPFSKKFPERFFDVGMAEEHGVTFSAGLAAAGMIPLTTIYSTFIQRAIDQIIHDVAVQNLHCVLCLDRAGLVGEDGAPQHGSFDVTFLRMIPGCVVMQPKNGEELRDMLWTAVRHTGPIAIRYPRANVPDDDYASREPRILAIGVSEQLRAGGDVAILALGTMVLPALQAAELLEKDGISATVINARFASPVDERVVTGLARSVGRIVTIEENVPMGGFGGAVHECLVKHDLSATPMLHLALPEQFVPHGKRDELLKEVGLDAPSIHRRTLEWVRIAQRQYT